MTLFLMRLSRWLECFFAAAHNLGFVNAFRLRVLQRHRPIPAGTSMRVKALGLTVHYRGAADYGSMSHFFRLNYRVCDTPQSPVRFIVDAGANIGVETLRFRHFHPQAKIIALEPEPGNFQVLVRNISADPNIFPVQKGLWPRDCALRVFQTRPHHNEAFRVEEVDRDPQPGDIPAITIPSLLRQFAFPEIDILKIDIEGAEYFVFDDSARYWVDKVKVFIFECPDNDRPGSAFRIFNSVAHIPLNCYIQGENLVMIRRDVPWKVCAELFYPPQPA